MNVLPCVKADMQVSPVTGCPSTYCTDENVERVRAMILGSRWVAMDEVAHHLHISHVFAHEIIHTGLSFNKV
jgi:hypothetical protein